MTLSTCAELKSEVASWLNRTDLTAQLAGFVRLAEAEIRRDVRVRAMQTLATGAMTDGAIDLPADFVEARRLVVNDRELSYITPEDFQRLTRAGYSDVRYFTSIGLQLRVLSGGSAAYDLLYWAAFAALSADNDTNWLLTTAPDVYLWKCCEKGSIYLRDVEGATGFRTLYDDALAKLARADYEAEFSGSVLEIRPQGVAA